ncbi:AraC family transcriptional regulator [Dinghuibacter silviterrae]|uniref:AraC family transcriptional regulator n=1 Tax=Dinghuibacter silviterrae TaxID=1539049 RepID=A0A4R8DU50_9BACT|nr:helix-turn-helix domain-containing protein [Dinghuibacter silviterrae]TDX01669.1 AraC family transcriptional regulator [Dinghuibacter silviterrae]
MLSIEQAIADFEGQWKEKARNDYFAVFLTKNTLTIASPRTVRDLTHVGTDASAAGIVFTRQYLARIGVLEEQIPAFDFPPHLMLEQQEADALASLLHLLKHKSQEQKDKPYTDEVIRHHFLAFLYELASLCRVRTGRKMKRTRKEELHVRFHHLLNDHVREERSVRFYAAKLFVTPKYLTETVKEVSGKTAGELIDEMVMREAKRLLGDPALSVNDIAGELHFSDQFFFRKFFKRHEGLTPSEFRRAI